MLKTVKNRSGIWVDPPPCFFSKFPHFPVFFGVERPLGKWEFGSLKALSMERWTAADFEKGSNYPVTLVVDTDRTMT